MSELSNNINELARKNEKIILQRLAETGQSTVANIMGTSESTISRMKDDGIKKVSALINALGLKIVPSDSLEVDHKELEAVMTLSHKWLELQIQKRGEQ